MAVQIPGFCGIYFNQPIPSNVKYDTIQDYSFKLKSYNKVGYLYSRIKYGYVPKTFMSYDVYIVAWLPGMDDRNHLTDNNYISSLKVGGVFAMYDGSDKDENGYHLSSKNKNREEERVKTLFYNTKAFLDDWLKIPGEYISSPGRFGFSTYETCDYELQNNHIEIWLTSVQDCHDVGIKVYDKFFYEYTQKYERNQKQGDINAFM